MYIIIQVMWPLANMVRVNWGGSAEGEGGGTGKGQEAEAWHLSPGLIPSLGDSCKVVWIGACSNQTFD